MDKALRAGQQHGAEAGQRHHLVLRSEPQQRARGLRIRGRFPGPRGFGQRIRVPEVGVRGRVGIHDTPGTVVALAPAPRGQLVGEVAAAKVGHAPLPCLVEGGAVVGDQREHHGVGLAFGGAVLRAHGRVDDAPVGLHETAEELFVERPRTAAPRRCGSDRCRDRRHRAGNGAQRADGAGAEQRAAARVGSGRGHAWPALRRLARWRSIRNSTAASSGVASASISTIAYGRCDSHQCA
ncbi:hypothetical protein D9M70_365690 [compost metagenome]